MAIEPNDRVVEIGPGRGALTYGLASRTKLLTLIELDRDLVKSLNAQFPGATILAEDVMKVPLELFDETRVVGNLPYNISTPILDRMSLTTNVVDMHFMLQREVADRLTASPGTKDWGRLSVIAQYHWKIEVVMDIDASVFDPVPAVESAFVYLQPRENDFLASDYGCFTNVLRTAFAQRRKTLRNSLKSYNVDWDQTTVDPSSRADQVSLKDFVALANHLSNS